MLKNFFKYLDEMTNALIVVSFSTMCIVIFLGVITRYILSFSLPWVEEIGRFLFLALSYLGIVLGMRGQNHLRVDVALLYFPKKLARYCEIFSQLVCLAFFLFIVWEGYNMTVRVYRIHQEAVSIPLPIWIVWAFIPFCAMLTSLQCMKNIYMQTAGAAPGDKHE